MCFRFLISLYLAIFCVALNHVCFAQEPSAGKQVEQKFQAKDSGQVPYLLYLPSDFQTGNAKKPLMLFLHGRGESDGPLSVVAKWGPPLLLSKGDSLPFIVVSPQCPKEDNWTSLTQQNRLIELLDAMIERYGADKDQIYLTGLSMGGSGAWRMVADHPNRFAAVVPICGRGDIKDAGAIKETAIWSFVGDQDKVFQTNVEMAEAIRSAGSRSFRMTSLENIGHNSWSAAYASPDLYAWLAKQSLSNRREPAK
jgi:predicted peptidase